MGVATHDNAIKGFEIRVIDGIEFFAIDAECQLATGCFPTEFDMGKLGVFDQVRTFLVLAKTFDIGVKTDGLVILAGDVADDEHAFAVEIFLK